MPNSSHLIPVITKNCIDDVVLQKFFAQEKFGNLINGIKSDSSPLVKTASVNNDTLVELFAKMMDCLNMKYSGKDIESLLEKLSSKESDNVKNASRKTEDKKEEVKIASKSIKDSHYQIDISKDEIKKSGVKMIMVSCYARDAYLGRYLIKRNFFFTQERENSANDAYEEIVTKAKAIKDRYYNEVIDVNEVFAQVKKTLDGVISEIKMEEDTVGNIHRNLHDN